MQSSDNATSVEEDQQSGGSVMLRKKLGKPNLCSSVMTVQGRYNNFLQGTEQSSRDTKCLTRWQRSLSDLNNGEHEFTDIPLNIDQQNATPTIGSLKNSARMTMMS